MAEREEGPDLDVPASDRSGLHLARRTASATRRRLTRWPVPLELDSPLTGLRTEGCALLPRMFSPAGLGELVEVARRVQADGGIPHFVVEGEQDGTVGARRMDLAEDDRQVLDRFWLHPTVLALLSAAERRKLEPPALRATVEALGVDRDGAGSTAPVRSDAADPTHAMVLYLSDVTESQGPFVYYPGSHRLTPRHLRAMFDRQSDAGSSSRTVSEAEIEARKLEPRSFASAKGTAVLVNTFGYHGWLRAAPGSERLVLRVEVARAGRSSRG